MLNRNFAVSLLILASTVALAQQPLTFQHVVIVIQENRTPDNLFGSCPPAGSDVVQAASVTTLANTPDLPHSHTAFVTDRSGKWMSPALAKSYVRAQDVVPYCQLAAQYGFANRMFQTNQGPSFPAHQFLISGTSAINDGSDVMAADNPNGSAYKHAGCNAIPGSWVWAIDDQNKVSQVYPCFNRSSILNLLDASGVTWRYYAATAGVIWTAPLALLEYYKSPNINFNPANFIKDASNCNLADVSYVTPTGAESDHAGGNTGLGPSWVASIVNAIGNSPCGYWNNTVVLVTWDDWGGWYDHVSPPVNNTGWAPYYAYGFRVPLLVISAHTPAMVDNIQHDFGSILRFVETNYGLGLIGPGTWADSYADNLSDFFVQQSSPYIPVPVKKIDWNNLPMTDPDDD
jgi:phospholipase C